MPDPEAALKISWVDSDVGNHALHFPRPLWARLSAVATELGAPSAQELVTQFVTDLINQFARKQPAQPLAIKFEWATYGDDPATSPEALLVFHHPTLPNIAELWQIPESTTRDTLALAILKPLEGSPAV